MHPSHTRLPVVAAAPGHLSLARWRAWSVVVVALVLVGVLGLTAAQAHAYSASLYWGADDAIGSATVDATGNPVAINRSLTTSCAGGGTFSASSTVMASNLSNNHVCAVDPSGNNQRYLSATSCTWIISAVLVTDSYVYYACRAFPWMGRVDIDGSNNNSHFASIPAGDTFAMAIDPNWIYVATFGGDIRRVPIDGGLVDPTFAVQAGAGQQIAVDSHHLYWHRSELARHGADEQLVLRRRRRGRRHVRVLAHG